MKQKMAKTTLTTQEVSAAIEALTPAQRGKLKRIAVGYCYNAPHEADDLLHHAFLAALRGSRKCPSDVSIVRFLAQAMRSIASAVSKAKERKPTSKFGELVEFDVEGEAIEYDPPDKGMSPEQILLSNETVDRIRKKILGLFPDDANAKTIAEGMMCKIEGEELRALTDLDTKAFDTKRRYVRRTIDKKFPKGRIT